MTKPLRPLQQTSPLLILVLPRLIAGFTLLVLGVSHFSDPDHLRQILTAGGLPFVELNLILVPLAECLAAGFLLSGLLARAGGMLGVLTMLIALYVSIRLAGQPEAPWVPSWPIPLVVLLASLWVLWEGAGSWSVDLALTTLTAEELEKAHHVVIIGGGFGGIVAARTLAHAPVRVTMIDRRNHHTFQPLLYQVATGVLSPSNIASPLRVVLGRQRNAEVLLGEAVDFDVNRRRVILTDGEVGYDSLIVAAGVWHQYFGHDQWEPLAPALKTIEDATEIRRRVLAAFEAAERQSDPQQRATWLTFVVVGGGATGVELAGAIAEMARTTLRAVFRHIDPAEAKVILLEGSQRILATFPESLSEKTVQSLQRLGVTPRTGVMVTDIQPDGVTVQEGDTTEHIPSYTVLWAAGVKASPLGAALAKATGTQLDRAGRVMVHPDCSLPGHPEIFVIGDLANFSHQGGQPLPGVAQTAMQQGKYVAKLIKRRLHGKSTPPFHYWDKGNLATIGRAAAVADLHFVRLSGYPAWLVWLFIHIMYIVTFRNRVLVFIQWAWNYFTRDRSSMLITGEYPELFRTETSAPAGASQHS